MNKVMDQWQDSIDRMAKDFAQKTRDFSAKANHSLKVKPIPQTSWKITTTRKGLSVESNVNSYNDLSKLVDQFKKSMTIKTKETNQVEPMDIPAVSTPPVEFDDTSSIHTSSGFSFAIWNSWNHPTHAMPEDYPIDISQELTDNLINLYCRTPCCSSLRLPIINTVDFLKRYHDPNPENRPSTVLIYAICAMAARNAFQLHVWSKRSSFEAPQYNMGKALSVAYCLKGRELLSECFDEPTLENCQAAFLLSYCNQQNGYPGVIYFYEWIAYNMALELGLYQPDRKLTRYESILIWCIYYCNTWYRILQSDGAPGSSINLGQCKPASPIPDLLPVPASLSSPFSDFKGESHQEAIDYYVWNSWVYLIKLQVLRGECMLKFMNNQSDRSDASLTQDVMSMQSALQTFHDDLPPEWKNDNNFDMSFDSDYQSTPSASPCSPGSCTSSEPSEILGGSGGNGEHDHYSVDIKSFSQHCINFVNINYYVNQIILHQAFIPMHRLPTTPISIQSLQISLNAADQVNRIISIMVHQREECHVPLISLLFANIIHRKLISYSDQTYSHTGKYGLLKSIDIAKSSINYVYDFEMARTLVSLMEQEVKKVVSIKDDDMISLETPSSMLMI
jgi:hypothetical protein